MQIEKAYLQGFKVSNEGWNGEYPFEGIHEDEIKSKIGCEQYYKETFKTE